MQIILLSGGSGKRLWPLSNDIRSKQFIRLFKNEDTDSYESMVMRVYRQIKSVAPDASITIATSKAQVSAIRSQLGDSVGICVEPCRRDTFPAIALACAYLADMLKVDEQESVVICPADPYVDASYFQSMCQLAVLAAQGGARLSLMGIEPTYPSEKYGYIIPQTGLPVSPVRMFREKPSTADAQALLDQGALWNAGVFAFQLGYLRGKTREIYGTNSYAALLERYDQLKKISFDYAVAEHEESVQVLRYHGNWQDVGTWNALCEVLPEPSKGNVVMDECCQNTHVINELNTPVLCMGCKDLIVVAGTDGLLVCDKNRADAMKPYAEGMQQDARYAEKSWGVYTVLDSTPSSQTARLTLYAGRQFSCHSHRERTEALTVVDGSGIAVVDGRETPLRAGDVIAFPVGCHHTVMAHTDMILIEVQTGSAVSKEDKQKYAP